MLTEYIDEALRRARYELIEDIAKGIAWSATRGDTAFTVPLFDRFMRRIMPGATWRDAHR